MSNTIWSKPPKFPVPLTYLSGEKLEALYFQQLNQIANNILLDDSSFSHVLENRALALTPLKWIYKGEVIAGSSLTNVANHNIANKDVDIYFHSVFDATAWANLNNTQLEKIDNKQFCAYTTLWGCRVNLIWGLNYTSAKDLIAGFDIRMCAMAYDPAVDMSVYVDGALEDAYSRQIIFQAGARMVSIHRLLKYIEKGCTISKYQRVIFAELIKSGKHSNDLELITGYGDVK